ncbi:hypothetical protein HK101_002860 [Irineochytrium annulatum]|nr:hypothetical protein HK101_002860 [Irineochytrium annulatum]
MGFIDLIFFRRAWRQPSKADARQLLEFYLLHTPRPLRRGVHRQLSKDVGRVRHHGASADGDAVEGEGGDTARVVDAVAEPPRGGRYDEEGHAGIGEVGAWGGARDSAGPDEGIGVDVGVGREAYGAGDGKEGVEGSRRLRRLILSEGVPDHEETFASTTAPAPTTPSCSLRGRIWKALLGIYRVSALEYVTLNNKGPCDVYDKLKNDTFRTLATDRLFKSRVDEGTLRRCLNAFVWKAKEQPPSRLMNIKFSYVQGMNVHAAPFLFVMPELDAYFTFTSFITHTCPLYVQPALEGVHCGIKLLDKCLKILDPMLFKHLKVKGLDTLTWAFPCVFPTSYSYIREMLIS